MYKNFCVMRIKNCSINLCAQLWVVFKSFQAWKKSSHSIPFCVSSCRIKTAHLLKWEKSFSHHQTRQLCATIWTTMMILNIMKRIKMCEEIFEMRDDKGIFFRHWWTNKTTWTLQIYLPYVVDFKTRESFKKSVIYFIS